MSHHVYLTFYWRSNQATRQEKEIEIIQIGKEGLNSLFADGMILPIKYPKEFIKKLLELINELRATCKYLLYTHTLKFKI